MGKGIEILAPAGNVDCVKAALRCGADAVYLGMNAFNARGNAPGFTAEELEEALRLCKLYGAKAYLTLNTVSFDREQRELRQLVREACALGFDAAIVQDLGTARLLRECCPSLPLHASTQMSVHSLRGAEELARLGFARVVAARELSQRELEALAARSPIQLEVFVHGALCMSVSGQCYLSALLGGRSGNRGLCAQPCRLPCSLSLAGENRPAGPGEGDHALSLRDLSLVPRLKELEGMGIASAKIEGRMKRAEYVAAAVTACREALGEGLTPETAGRLHTVFSRGEFTQGYYLGKRDKALFGVRERQDGAESAKVRKELGKLYEEEPQVLPVEMEFRAEAGEPPVLTACCRGETVSAAGEQAVQAARTKALGEEDAAALLGKTGGTPFFLDKLRCEIGAGLFLPAAALNKLRRDALGELAGRLSTREPHPFVSWEAEDLGPALPGGGTALRGRFERAEQVYEGAQEDFERIVLPLGEWETPAGKALSTRMGGKLLAELPRFFPGDEEALLKALERAKGQGAAGVVSGNLSGVSLAKEAGLPLCMDFGMNLTNSLALEKAGELGAREAVLSFETPAGAIRALRKYSESCPRVGAIAYGYLPVMLTRSCPVHHRLSCGQCGGKTGAGIVDRTGAFLPLLCKGGYAEILGNVPLYLGHRMERFAPVEFGVLYFTKEPAEACRKVVKLFREGAEYPGEFTTGLYYRKV